MISNHHVTDRLASSFVLGDTSNSDSICGSSDYDSISESVKQRIYLCQSVANDSPSTSMRISLSSFKENIRLPNYLSETSDVLKRLVETELHQNQMFPWSSPMLP
jgi:hypothetical protein